MEPGRKPDARDGPCGDAGVAVGGHRHRIGVVLWNFATILVIGPEARSLDGRIPFGHQHVVIVVIGLDLIGGWRGRARVRLVNTGPVLGTRRFAEEYFFGLRLVATHQRQTDKLVGAVGIARLVVHHERHEGAVGPRRGQQAGDLAGDRRAQVIDPLQFIGIRRGITDGACHEVGVIYVEDGAIITKPSAFPTLAGRQSTLLGQCEAVGIGKLLHNFTTLIIRRDHGLVGRLHIRR